MVVIALALCLFEGVVMAQFSTCKYQGYADIDKKDKLPKVYCNKISGLCVAQKFCRELNKFVVSERAYAMCKLYEK